MLEFGEGGKSTQREYVKITRNQKGEEGWWGKGKGRGHKKGEQKEWGGGWGAEKEKIYNKQKHKQLPTRGGSSVKRNRVVRVSC